MIRIGIIGTGSMAGSHANRFKAIKGCRLVACADIVPGKALEFAAKFGIPAAYNDAEEMLTKEKPDGVSVVTPDKAHAPMTLLAIKHGVHVMCEKPLADTVENAGKMLASARKRKLINCVNFSKRNIPEVQKAAQLVASGELGRIMHVEGNYRQGWLGKLDFRNAPHSALWRLSTKHGSAGVLGDLGVHLYDLASFIAGDFAEIFSEVRSFDKGVRKVGPYVLDANDSVVTAVRFKAGGIGTLYTTRWATGHTNDMTLNIYGDRGAIEMAIDGQAPNVLRFHKVPGKTVDRWDWSKQAWREIPGGKTISTYEQFVKSIRTGQPAPADFATAYRVQKYLAASLLSARLGRFVKTR